MESAKRDKNMFESIYSCVFPFVNAENRDGLLPIDDHISRNSVDVLTVLNESCSFNLIIQNLIKHAMWNDGFENMIIKDTNRNSAFNGVLELLISKKMISGNIVKSIIHQQTDIVYCIELCHH